MGKKYIIELESGTHIFVLGPEGIVHIGEPDVVYETVDGMQIGDAVINAKPYAEPDLGAIKQEEYEKGYKTAKVQCDIQTEKDLREVGERHYQKGLSDAWEAARKIWKYDTTILRAIFGEGTMRMDWFMKFTASEAIEKIRQYEQEKEGELGIREYFKNGEEVIDADGTKAVILRVSEDNYCQVYTEKGCIENWHIHTYKFHKTGRHFPEIAEVMQKMKEEQK